MINSENGSGDKCEKVWFLPSSLKEVNVVKLILAHDYLKSTTEFVKLRLISKQWRDWVDRWYGDEIIQLKQLKQGKKKETNLVVVEPRPGDLFALNSKVTLMACTAVTLDISRISAQALHILGTNLPMNLRALKLIGGRNYAFGVFDSWGEHASKLKTLELEKCHVEFGKHVASITRKATKLERINTDCFFTILNLRDCPESRVYLEATRFLFHKALKVLEISSSIIRNEGARTYLMQDLIKKSPCLENFVMIGRSGSLHAKPENLPSTSSLGDLPASLITVHLADCVIDETLHNRLNDLPLQSLTFNNCHFQDCPLTIPIKSRNSLLHFSLQSCRGIRTGDLKKAIDALPPTLTHLTLAFEAIPGEWDTVYVRLVEKVQKGYLPNLKILDLRHFNDLQRLQFNDLTENQAELLTANLPKSAVHLELGQNITDESAQKISNNVHVIMKLSVHAPISDPTLITLGRKWKSLMKEPAKAFDVTPRTIDLHSPHLTDAGFIEFAKHLGSLISGLEIDGAQITENGLSVLLNQQWSSSLRHLRLKSLFQLRNLEAVFIFIRDQGHNLKELSICDCQELILDQHQLLPLKEGLEIVDFSTCNHLSPAFLVQLIKILPRSTRELRLANTKVNDEVLEAIKNAKLQLLKLDIRDCVDITDRGLECLLQWFPDSLEQLQWKGCKGIQTISLKNSLHLTEMQLKILFASELPETCLSIILNKSASVTNEVLKLVLRNASNNLRVLELSGCISLTEDGLVSMDLPSELQALNLSETECDDTVAFKLFPSLPSKLRRLNLSGCPQLTDLTPLAQNKNIGYLMELNLEGCHGLRRISLSQFRNLTPEFLEKFCKSLPDCVEWLDLSGVENISLRVLNALIDNIPQNLQHIDLSGCQALSNDQAQLLIKNIHERCRKFASLHFNQCPNLLGLNFPAKLHLSELSLEGSSINLAITALPDSLNYLAIGPIDDVEAAELAKKNLPRLKGLNLSGSTKLTDGGLSLLLTHFEGAFDRLSINGCIGLKLERDNIIRGLRNVQHFEFSNATLDDSSLAALVKSLHGNLYNINLSVTQAGKKTMKALIKRNNLKVINLSECKKIDDDMMSSILSVEWKKLDLMDLTGTTVKRVKFDSKNSGIGRLFSSLCLPEDLLLLDLTNCTGLSVEAVRDFAQRRMPCQLKELFLGDCQWLNDRLMKAILLKCEKLICLNIEGTSVDGEFLDRLPRSVTTLHMANCKNLMDYNVQSLRAETLHVVDLSFCSQLSRHTVDATVMAAVNARSLLLNETLYGGCPFSHKLEKIELRNCPNMTDEVALKVVQHGARNKTVDLSGCSLTLLGCARIEVCLGKERVLLPYDTNAETLLEIGPEWVEMMVVLAAHLPKLKISNVVIKANTLSSIEVLTFLKSLPQTVIDLEFCDQVAVPPPDKWIPNLRSLKRLCLAKQVSWNKDQYGKVLEMCPQTLRVLSLDSDLIDDEIVKKLKSFPPGLEELTLRSNKLGNEGINELINKALINHPRMPLRYIDISRSSLSDRDAIKLVTTFSNTLDVLLLDNCTNLSSQFIRNFPSSCSHRLRRLSLRGCQNVQLEWLLAKIPTFIQCKINFILPSICEFRGMQLTDHQLMVMGEWIQDDIEQLGLRDNKVSDIGLLAFADRWGKKLQQLDLGEIPALTDAGLEDLLAKCPTTLLDLDLRDTSISGAGLVDLDRFQHLIRLDLSQTHIDDRSALNIVGPNLPSDLKNLLLANTTNLTAAGLRALVGCLSGHINQLDLEGTDADDSVFKEAVNIQRIEELFLANCVRIENIIEVLIKSYGGRLGLVDLGAADLEIPLVLKLSRSGAKVKWTCPKQIISLDCQDLSDTELKTITNWLSTQVTELSFVNIQEGIRDLNWLGKFVLLQVLKINHSPNFDTKTNKSLILTLPSTLQHLSLVSTGVSDEGLKTLVTALQHGGLTRFDFLHNQRLTDQGIQCLAKLPSSVTSLNLGRCDRLTTVGLALLASGLVQSDIELSLTSLPVSSKFFRCLRENNSIQKIKLNLVGCTDWTPGCVRALGDFGSKLERVNLSESDLPIHEVMALQRKLGIKCPILWQIPKQQLHIYCSHLNKDEMIRLISWLRTDVHELLLSGTINARPREWLPNLAQRLGLNHQLTSFSLPQSDILTEEIRALAPLLVKLEHLAIKPVQFGDAAHETRVNCRDLIAALPSGLKSLTLIDERAGDTCAIFHEHADAIRDRLTSLTSLSVTGTNYSGFLGIGQSEWPKVIAQGFFHRNLSCLHFRGMGRPFNVNWFMTLPLTLRELSVHRLDGYRADVTRLINLNSLCLDNGIQAWPMLPPSVKKLTIGQINDKIMNEADLSSITDLTIKTNGLLANGWITLLGKLDEVHTNITSLHLLDCVNLADANLGSLFDVCARKKWRVLEINGRCSIGKNAAFKSFGHPSVRDLTSLQTLKIENCELSDTLVADLFPLPSNLTVLSLAGSSGVTAAALGQVRFPQQLVELDLSRCSWLKDIQCCIAIRLPNSLRTLKLQNCNLNANAFKELRKHVPDKCEIFK